MDIHDGEHKAVEGVRVGPLGRRVAGGFAWMLAKTAGTKFAAIATQIILAWLLVPEDFGLVALAYSVTVFVTHIKTGGIREVLIQKQHRYHELAGPGLWLSVIVGILCALLLVALAPIAAWMFREPDLTGLIWVLAVATLITGPVTIPMAQLQNEMRFRSIAAVEVFCGLSRAALAVGFAIAGFGAYAFVLPLPIIGVVRVAVLWYLARPPWTWNPHWRRWGELIGAGGLLMAAALFTAVNQQGANFILGLFHSAAVVGIFFFAFNLSMQVHNILMLNLSHVLLPSLSKLKEEPERQQRAFVRACSMLALVGVPAAVLIAACADPFIRAVFAERWFPAIPVLQALALGMALNINSQTAQSLIMAQGHYWFNLWICILRALLFVMFVTVGAIVGGAVAVGVATGLFFAIYGPGIMYAAIRGSGSGWRTVWQVHATPLGASLLAAAIAVAVSMFIPDMPARHWLRTGIVVVTFAVIYIPAIRWAAPLTWEQLLDHLRTLARGILPTASADETTDDATISDTSMEPRPPHFQA